MPFITKEKREVLDYEMEHDYPRLDKAIVAPGDLCYIHYKKMVDKWKTNPRWTTAHEIFKEVEDTQPYDRTNDDWIDKSLAWQCFFHYHVLPYEDQKRKDNGDI